MKSVSLGSGLLTPRLEVGPQPYHKPRTLRRSIHSAFIWAPSSRPGIQARATDGSCKVRPVHPAIIVIAVGVAAVVAAGAEAVAVVLAAVAVVVVVVVVVVVYQYQLQQQ